MMVDEVRLRDVAAADLPILFEQQTDPDAVRMAAFPSRARDAFMAHWTKILDDDAVTRQAVVFDGRLAGYMVCFERAGERLVGYWIGREYWGRGIATRALAAFLDLVPDRPLHARVAKHNLASIRVLEKCGFTVSGEEEAASSAGGDEVEEFIMTLAGTPSA
ncbi:MAG TPA: GNAT family N-acetyltransferase [Thermoanaerobaculia bacterium]|nr:GNAT family N-acetyltransferase [Thermoanaerobaculia bacterium]